MMKGHYKGGHYDEERKGVCKERHYDVHEKVDGQGRAL